MIKKKTLSPFIHLHFGCHELNCILFLLYYNLQIVFWLNCMRTYSYSDDHIYICIYLYLSCFFSVSLLPAISWSVIPNSILNLLQEELVFCHIGGIQIALFAKLSSFLVQDNQLADSKSRGKGRSKFFDSNVYIPRVVLRVSYYF